jgi:hypothetical protein
MSERESGRSPQLDEVRRMLFPKLTPDEGWARIDDALRGASDPERRAAIERIAAEEDLNADLLRALRKLLRDPPPE